MVYLKRVVCSWNTKAQLQIQAQCYLLNLPLYRWLAAGIDLYTMNTHQTNYGIAGAIVGGLSRFILGPRAVVAASILGFSLG